MTAIGFVTVLLFHSVVAGVLSEPLARPAVGRALAYPSVQRAQAWPYPYRRWYAPREILECTDGDCSPRNDAGERPWRLVSLSLSAGFAYSAGAEVSTGESGGAFGVRLGAGLVDRLSLTVAFESTTGRRNGQDEFEGAALVGLQWYPLSFLYLRGAAGAGVVSYADQGGYDRGYAGGSSGVLHPALSTALGLELSNQDGFAFGIEGVGSWMYIPGESWRSVQVRCVVILNHRASRE
jgi:hypothetical protein